MRNTYKIDVLGPIPSAHVDLHENQGSTEWGIHVALTGGPWMSVVFGCGGFRVKNNNITFKPWLSKKWEELQHKLKWRGDDLKVSIRHNEGVFTLLSDDQKTEEIVVFDKSYHLESGKETTIPF